jgi:hypothetical protein
LVHFDWLPSILAHPPWCAILVVMMMSVLICYLTSKVHIPFSFCHVNTCLAYFN